MIITSKRLCKSILTALADEEILKILNSTTNTPKSVNDIISECFIPHTTAYRKIKWLVEENILIIDKTVVTSEGKKLSMFSSIYKSFNISYDKNNITINAEILIDRSDRIANHFFSL